MHPRRPPQRAALSLALLATLLVCSCARLVGSNDDGGPHDISASDASKADKTPGVDAGVDGPPGDGPSGPQDLQLPQDVFTGDAGAAADGNPTAVASFGANGEEDGYDVAVGPAGEVAIVGTFQGNVNFGGKALTSSGGSVDGYVAVLAPGGASARWAQAIGAPAVADRAQGVAFDNQGNVYVCGLFRGQTNFGGQVRQPVGAWDAYVASYDKQGGLRWVSTVGGSGNDFAYDVATAPGRVLVTGYYEGSVAVATKKLPAAGGREVFVVEFDAATGVPRWGRGFAGTSGESGQGVAVDKKGEVIVVGFHGGPLDFGSGVLAPKTSTAGFVAKLSADGQTLRWARSDDGTAAWDVDIGPTGELFVASRFGVGTDLGQGTLQSEGSQDGLLLKLAPQNGAILWYRQQGGTDSDLALGVTVDGQGNSYVVGIGGPAMDFGDGKAVQGNGKQDAYIASYDPKGVLRWGALVGGGEQDRGYGVAAAPGGGLYFSGRFAQTGKFGPSTTLSKSSAGASDAFLLRFD